MKLERTKLIITVCIAVAVMLTAYGIFYYIRQLNNIHITISVVPSDAKVTLNGTEFRSGGAWLKPGAYTIEVAKDGFETYKAQREIADGFTLTTALLPKSEAAQEWFDNNQEQYKRQEDLVNKLSDKYIESVQEQYSDLGALPISLPAFTIEYRPDENGKPVIYIEAYDGSRNAALAKLYEVGIDPANYKLEFSDYTNPFGGPHNEP